VSAARLALLLGVVAAYVAAVRASEEPAVMALGLAPIAWIALEACWRLFDPRD
jgi:hypothetical protein